MTQALPIANGCDAHVHVIGSRTLYPMCPDRRYTPPEASAYALKEHLRRIGLSRAVIVQPSVYGNDNRCLLDTLAQMQDAARGIAVLAPETSPAELRKMDAQGVRGIRLNLESVNNHDAEVLRQALQHWGPRLADVGWHVQIYAPMVLVVACADTIRQMPVPCVLDHFAMWNNVACADLAAQAVLQLLREGCVYIKLSGSYRVPVGAGGELVCVAKRLLDSNAERLLWASDWPHTRKAPDISPLEESSYRVIAPATLISERDSWLREPSALRQVLVGNAERLYRF